MIITVLTWISLIAGGILVLLLLISLIGGLDIDVDMGSTEVDVDSGGIGVIKGILTFTSVASWVIKVLLVSQKSPLVAIAIGLISGILAFMLLSYLFRLLLRNEHNVNWSMEDALFSKADVYLKIGPEKSGLINTEINGATRELKAITKGKEIIKTGAQVMIVGIEGEYAVVESENNQ